METFVGAGGSYLGLKKAGFKTIYVNFGPSKFNAFRDVFNSFKKIKKIVFTYSISFSRIINLMNTCSYIIGNESGPICIGAALKKKVMSIYYPKHTNTSSKTIYSKVKFFNSDIISSKKIISNIIKDLK